ncbi:MAG: Omp28-related outer membrane protein [Chitinophagales bacterium]|nr:Omp28-related outer membrane protein [Chitinophagales bacterium]
MHLQNRIRLLIALASTLLYFNSCKEVGPAIDLTGETTTDTTYIATQIETPQDKNVLLEEFTGVRCVNCPQGHELLDNLENQHGERFIAVSDHSEFLADPYDGDQDLRTDDAQAFEDLLGPISAKPSAAVDRKLFSGETSLVYFTQKWANYVNQQISQTTPVNIHIETAFSNNTRNLDVIITVHYTSEELQDNKLTVLLLEDGIITAQIGQGSVLDTAYNQNRVLRQSLTSTNGLALNTTKEAGRVIVKSFTVENLPLLWNADELRVIALVHRSGSAMDVLQAVQRDVN